MGNNLKLFVMLGILVLASCNMKPSYDVRVVNDTEFPIVIEYQSAFPNKNLDSATKVTKLEPGQNQIIIKTPDLESTDGKACEEVADYVIARRVSDGMQSSLEWCSNSIELEMVDLGQYQYLIKYGPDDF